MLDRLLDRFVSLVTRRRGLVIASVLGIVLSCASQLPHLAMDSSPELLMISSGAYAAEARDFRARFGDPDSVVVLCVVGPDVTALAALQYVHDLSRHFQ